MTLRYIIFLSLITSVACAQKDTVNLHEVSVTSSRFSYNSGLRQQHFDSLLLSSSRNTSLSELLNENSASYLRNYGPGALSLISLRGGSAYQTAILWNGINISSPTHGLSDLSLIPNFFFDDMYLQFGGTSYLWGSGAVSGNIMLTNAPAFNSGLRLTLHLGAGSFSDFRQGAGISWGGKKYFGSLKIFHAKNENDFTFIDESTGETKNQVHSAIKQTGIINNNYLITGKYSVLNFRIWHQYSDREIPPTQLQSNPDAGQLDVNTRLSAEWKRDAAKSEIIIRSAWLYERLNYDDNFLSQPSDNKSNSLIGEATYEYRISPRHSILAGAGFNRARADSSANLVDADEEHFSFFTLYRYRSSSEKVDATASARKEFSSHGTYPIVLSGGLNYSPLDQLRFRFAASHVYRNPTLNDLYWNPGGNPDLNPEDGYSAEAGSRFTIPLEKESSHLIFDATIYYKKISDWIIWYPSSSSLVWKPQNLLEVVSKGAELSLKYRIKRKTFSAGADAEFFYTKSTNEKSVLANDASLHQQLIYVPMYRWNARVFLTIKGFTLNYNHSYTGYRYTSSDNYYYLEPFTLDNIQVDKSFGKSSYSIDLFLRVSNIFDSSYESVANRPMALRTYSAGLTITYQKSKHK